jgi:hypothetical protein
MLPEEQLHFVMQSIRVELETQYQNTCMTLGEIEHVKLFMCYAFSEILGISLNQENFQVTITHGGVMHITYTQSIFYHQLEFHIQ